MRESHNNPDDDPGQDPIAGQGTGGVSEDDGFFEESDQAEDLESWDELNELDGYEPLGSAPHRDDRLWRHPSEVAAELAARAAGDFSALPEPPTLVTAPAVRPQQSSDRMSRRQMATASIGAALVGLGVLTLGFLSVQSFSAAPKTSALVAEAPAGTGPSLADSPGSSVSNTASNAALGDVGAGGTGSISIGSSSTGSTMDAPDLYGESSAALAHVQTARAGTMTEGHAVVVTAQGHLATSASLIAGADYVVVWLDDGSRWPANVIAADDVSDVAIVRIDRDTRPVSLGSHRIVRSGQQAMIADHASRSMRRGEVSTFHLRAKGDGTTGASRFVVSGLPVLAGSAIFDDSGDLIGITGEASQSGVAIATPAWMLERVAIDLITVGATSHSWFGAEVEATAGDQSVTITEVDAGSPAHRSDLNVGDRISALDGIAVTDSASFWNHLRVLPSGAIVELQVERWGDTRIMLVELGSR